MNFRVRIILNFDCFEEFAEKMINTFFFYYYFNESYWWLNLLCGLP
jgi:hypothetical protein